MVLLPSPAIPNFNTSTSNYNPADLFTRPLTPTTQHRFKSRIPLSLSTTTTVTATTVATRATSVVSASVVSTSDPHSDSVVPSTGVILDTGASFSRTPFKSDFDSGTPTPELLLLFHKRLFGIPRSALESLLALDPYTLLTGEDTVASELSSPDSSEFAFDFASALTSSRRFQIKYFGTAILIFKYSNSDLVNLFVEPDLHLEDWLHWTPIPRLTLRDSYFQVVPGTTLDYTQVFALLHLFPIWFYIALLCFE